MGFVVAVVTPNAYFALVFFSIECKLDCQRIFYSAPVLLLSLDFPYVFPVVRHGCAAAAAKLLQSCLTLCDPIDSSPPDSLIPGILQARILDWVAISFSNA